MEKYKAREFYLTKLVAIVDEELAMECLRAIGKEDYDIAFKRYCKDGKPFVAFLIFGGDGYVGLDFAYRDYGGVNPVRGGKIYIQENCIHEYQCTEGIALTEQICFQTFLGILKTIDRTKIKVR